MQGWPSAALFGLCLLGFAAGCSREKTERAAGPEDGGARNARVGIRVPLPPDWEARQGADGELRVGPTGKPPLLRIARRPPADSSAPTVATLRALLPDKVSKAVTAARDSSDARIVTYPLDDARRAFGLIGARRMGNDWLLCASQRALDAPQLESAVEACAGLTSTGR